MTSALIMATDGVTMVAPCISFSILDGDFSYRIATNIGGEFGLADWQFGEIKFL